MVTGRSILLGLLAGAAMGLSASPCGAADYLVARRGPPGYMAPVPPLDAAGCYYYRGRQWCGRYCYYEVNGRRYCQRREREAVPQAPFPVLPPPPVGMK